MAGQVESLQDREPHERGDPLPVRRYLPDLRVPVRHTDGLDPVGPVRGEVVGGEVAAGPDGEVDHHFGERPRVEHARALAGEGLEGGGVIGEAPALAGRGRTALACERGRPAHELRAEVARPGGAVDLLQEPRHEFATTGETAKPSRAYSMPAR